MSRRHRPSCCRLQLASHSAHYVAMHSLCCPCCSFLGNRSGGISSACSISTSFRARKRFASSACHSANILKRRGAACEMRQLLSKKKRQLLASRTNIGAYLGPKVICSIKMYKFSSCSCSALDCVPPESDERMCDALRNSRDDALLAGCRSAALGIEDPFG